MVVLKKFMNPTQPEEYSISPGESKKRHIKNRIKQYRDSTESVYQALSEIGKTKDLPTYSEECQSVGDFFRKANGFWNDSEDPEQSYLEARKSLPMPDDMHVSSIPVSLEETAKDGELSLYTGIEDDGDIEMYWEMETEADRTAEIENLEQFANRRITDSNSHSWKASKSFLTASD